MYNVPSEIFTAILRQESNYKLNRMTKISGIDENTGQVTTVITDYGISMINFRNLKRYNFDYKKLLEDLEYSVEAGVLVLKNKKKRYGKRYPETWWTFYHSPTKVLRERYKLLVERYM
jgi:hypothetical protein